MALVSTFQDDWGAGIYRGRKAPANAVYDAVNALVSDEGLLFKRGGSAYYSASNTTDDLTWLVARFMPAVAANRILTGGASSLNVLDGSLNPVSFGAISAASRVVGVGDIAVLLLGGGSPTFAYYGGSLKASSYSTGGITINPGETTVTGTGTSWTANADAGMIFQNTGLPVVKSVDSDTQITLTRPWVDIAQSNSAYNLYPLFAGLSLPLDMPTVTRAYLGSAGQRLLLAAGNRIYYSDRNDFGVGDNYHELPAGEMILGIEGQGETAFVFSTGGVWAISNLSLDDVDDFGNIQHSVERITKDVILWDDYGISGYASGLILPCIDDVFIAGPDFSLQPITGDATDEKIRRQYRSYVKAGYTPGLATTHRGHYLLPIMNGTSWVDTLICRVDRGAAWTRWSGHAAGTAFATLPSQKLLATSGKRVIDASGCFDPTTSNASDADASVPDCVITTRDYPTGQKAGFVQKLRARYELTDDGSGGTTAPTVAVAYSSDQDAGVFTTLTDKGEEGGAAGWGVSDGSKYQFSWVAKRRERIRFRFTQSGAAGSFVFRALEMLHRAQGRQ